MEREIISLNGHHLKLLSLLFVKGWNTTLQDISYWGPEYGNEFIEKVKSLLVEIDSDPKHLIKITGEHRDSICSFCPPHRKSECDEYMNLHPERKSYDLFFIKHFSLEPDNFYTTKDLRSSLSIFFPPI